MKRLVLFLLLCTGLILLGEVLEADQKVDEEVISGTISLPEISGAVLVGDRLLVAADDPEDKKDNIKKFHMIALLKDAWNRLESKQHIVVSPEEQIYRNLLLKLPGQKLDADIITDLEDVTTSPHGDIFLITSHSLSKQENSPSKRKRLVQLRINRDAYEIENATLNTDVILEKLPEELKESTKRRPGEKDAQGKYNPGFNIEGLAWAPEGDLLIGLRSPIESKESKALVLRLKNANNIFDKPTEPVALTIESELYLERLGIRGMCYDEKRKGYWIIAGLSPDPDNPEPALKNEWSIWFWDGKKELKKKWEKAKLPEWIKLDNPEAVSLIKKENEDAASYLLLISDNGEKKPSTYVLIPFVRLE
jgi:hypothetical protein